MRYGNMLGLLATAAAITTAAPASALVINLNDIGGVTGSRADQGFRIAARYWESVLTSNVVMNIDVGFSNLGAGVLGGTSTTLQQFVPISNYYSLLNGNANKSALDQAAYLGLRPLDANGGVNVTVPGYLDPTTQSGVTTGPATRQAPTGEAIGSTIALASANYKALLNDGSGAGTTDAEIQFSSTFNFDFDPTDGIAAGSYDFIGVAVHEIGHALGFLSGADDFDYVAGDPSLGPLDDAWWGYGLDMFRYSAADKLDWTFGTDSYFSLDGGVTPYLDGYFSTGEYNGDGWQASHWKEPNGGGCSNLRGIMNPYICDGLGDETKGLDLALFDAIGWNTNVDVTANPGYTFSTAQMYRQFADAAVPESSTWAMMIVGMGAVGAGMRRRRVRAVVRFA